MNARGDIVGTRSAVALLTRALLVEALRRREFYVLLLFMGLYLVGATVVRLVGVEDATTASFVLNLGLTLAFFLGHLLTLLLAVRAIPDEIESRTIYPVLAKPVARHDYFLGKWFAAWATGLCTSFVLLALAWLPAKQGGSVHAGTFVQMVVLQIVSLAMLAGLGMFFSILLPKSVSIVVLLVIFLAGQRIATAIRGRLIDSPLAAVFDWLLAYVPHFGFLNIIDRTTDGLPPLGAGEMCLRIVYAVCVTLASVTVGSYLFHRRAL